MDQESMMKKFGTLFCFLVIGMVLVGLMGCQKKEKASSAVPAGKAIEAPAAAQPAEAKPAAQPAAQKPKDHPAH